MELLIQSNPSFTRPPSADHIIFSPPKTKPISLSFKSSHQHRINSIPFSLLKTNARFTISIRASLAQLSTSSPPSTHWMVVMQKPPNAESSSRAEIIDYYSQTLAKVLPSEKEAQMCIYRASWQSDFFFCCDIDEASSRELACLPEVLSVSPESDLETVEKDLSFSDVLLAKKSNPDTCPPKFPPSNGNSHYWLVKMEKPGVEVVTKAQMVDYFAQTLTKVLGNEKDAQACIYNISWEKDFGFCCQIDEESARELSGVPGVLYVQPDLNFESENKNYKVEKDESDDSAGVSSLPEVKTKRLFVTGLSFYTSEKTLRANFEPFGELVEVKVIMDKISKRSKGYAFIEYTTEEAAAAALKEMNGKIINGWMIVVDVAKTNPPKYSRARPRQPFSSSSSTY